MKIRRTMIIVPGNVQAYVDKARSFEADVVTLDLQDSIVNVDEAKLEGRRNVVAALQQGGFKARELCVRVNSPSSRWFVDDLRAVCGAGARSIRLTHAYGAADVIFAERLIKAFSDDREVDIQLGLDMPSAVVDLEEIARQSTLVTGLSLSPSDLTLELGSANHGPRKHNMEAPLLYTRSKILTVARARGWNAGDFAMNVDQTDAEAFRTACHASRAFGFDGMAVIYPRALGLANDVFGVDAENLAWAENFVAKWDEQDKGPDWHRAYRTIDGKGYFQPTYEYAQRQLLLHRVINGDAEATEIFSQHGLGSANYLAERTAGSS